MSETKRPLNELPADERADLLVAKILFDCRVAAYQAEKPLYPVLAGTLEAHLRHVLAALFEANGKLPYGLQRTMDTLTLDQDPVFFGGFGFYSPGKIEVSHENK